MTPRVQTLGYLEQGSGPALLLVHGFPLDARLFAEQLTGLSKLRRVLAVDLRGRGRSRAAADGPWSLESHADDLARLLDALAIDRVDLGGLSMGGYVAMAFLRLHPKRVRSLLLLSTKTAADSPEVKQSRLETAERVRREGCEALAASMLPKLVAPRTNEAVRAKVAAMIRETPPETAARDSLAMRERGDSTALLARAEVPVLVVHGEEDALMPGTAARSMAAGIAHAQFISIAGAGHVAPLEQPAAVNQALAAFLTSVAR
jgi:3-oxoadipate enol-lactonase